MPLFMHCENIPIFQDFFIKKVLNGFSMYDSQNGEDSIFGISVMRDGRFLPVFVDVPGVLAIIPMAPRGGMGKC